MKFDSSFFLGVGVGLVGCWALHRYVRPLPSTKSQ